MNYMYNNAIQSTTRITIPDAPGVFNVIESIGNDRRKKFTLELVTHRYDVPTRLYGKLRFYIDFYWRRFKKHNFRAGLLLTGSAGAGKTELAKILCNNAIDSGLRVITLTNVKFSIELISYLDSLNGVLLFFDEFSKTFRWDNQEKMLTLLSNTLAKERLVIMTENNKSTISEFIRNRPGRVLYSKHFSKIESETVIEYLNDHPIDIKFKDKFMDLYKRVTTFTFDHLSAIVSEHLDEPDIDFDMLIELLNLEGFSPSKVISLVDIIYTGDDDTFKDFKFDNTKTNMVPKLPRESILTSEGFFVWMVTISYKDDKENILSKTLEIKRGYLTEFMDETVKFMVDEFELTYNILLEKDVTVSLGSTQQQQQPTFNQQPSFKRRFLN